MILSIEAIETIEEEDNKNLYSVYHFGKQK